METKDALIGDEALIGILDGNGTRNDVIRLATRQVVGVLDDSGDRFIFKPTTALSEEEAKQVNELVEMFNDRSVGDFWQAREAEIEAAIPEEIRIAQVELKSILGDDYLTEEEVRRSVSMFPTEITDAFVELWKETKIVPKGRNEYGEIVWMHSDFAK